MLLNQLDQAAAVLSTTVENIEAGGCCVIASIVGNQIKDKVDNIRALVLSTTAVTLDHAKERADDDTNVSHLQDHGGLWISHVVIEFEVDGVTTYFDTNTGVCSGIDTILTHYDWGMDVIGEISLDEAECWADTPEAWNNKFDRDDIPMMEAIVHDLIAA